MQLYRPYTIYRYFVRERKFSRGRCNKQMQDAKTSFSEAHIYISHMTMLRSMETHHQYRMTNPPITIVDNVPSGCKTQAQISFHLPKRSVFYESEFSKGGKAMRLKQYVLTILASIGAFSGIAMYREYQNENFFCKCMEGMTSWAQPNY